MILSALFGLAQSLLYCLVLYCFGKILSNSEQLRRFLGLASEENKEDDYIETKYWVEKIGGLIQIIAIVSAIGAIITTLTILVSM